MSSLVRTYGIRCLSGENHISSVCLISCITAGVFLPHHHECLFPAFPFSAVQLDVFTVVYQELDSLVSCPDAFNVRNSSVTIYLTYYILMAYIKMGPALSV